MAAYLFIESRDPFSDSGVGRSWELARSLAGSGHQVSVYLVQNATLAARKGVSSSAFADGDGVDLLVDDVSIRERAIATDQLRPSMRVSNMDALIELTLEEGRKVIWS